MLLAPVVDSSGSCTADHRFPTALDALDALLTVVIWLWLIAYRPSKPVKPVTKPWPSGENLHGTTKTSFLILASREPALWVRDVHPMSRHASRVDWPELLVSEIVDKTACVSFCKVHKTLVGSPSKQTGSTKRTGVGCIRLIQIAQKRTFTDAESSVHRK